MPADILFYALVAAGLVFWLRSILGTRHGDERQRPNPFTSHSDTQGSDQPQPESPYLAGVEELLTPEQQIMELSENPTNRLSVENKSAEAGLIEISRADRMFDINHFLQGAQDAFVIIVEAFSKGDKDTLENLLSEDVYDAFAKEIKAREKRKETASTEIHAVRRTEVIEAEMKEKMAFVTVRFTADETCVTRDADEKILSGDPDRVTEMIDIWVFGRDIRSRDPRWLVYETREPETEEVEDTSKSD